MITVGNLCAPEDLWPLIEEAMETDNQLALDLAYSIYVWKEQASEVFSTSRATVVTFENG